MFFYYCVCKNLHRTCKVYTIRVNSTNHYTSCVQIGKKILTCIEFLNQMGCEHELWPWLWVNCLAVCENLHVWQELYTTVGRSGRAKYQLYRWSIGPLIECPMLNVIKVNLLLERTSGVPPIIFFLQFVFYKLILLSWSEKGLCGTDWLTLILIFSKLKILAGELFSCLKSVISFVAFSVLSISTFGLHILGKDTAIKQNSWGYCGESVTTFLYLLDWFCLLHNQMWDSLWRTLSRTGWTGRTWSRRVMSFGAW